jgi:hypothetical protein
LGTQHTWFVSCLAFENDHHIIRHVSPEMQITKLDGPRGLAVATVLICHFGGALNDQGVKGVTKLIY